MGKVYDRYFEQVKKALSRKELDGTFDKYYEDTWNGEYYCWDEAWDKFIGDMIYSDDVTGYENGFKEAEEFIKGWTEDKGIINLLEEIGLTSIQFYELGKVDPNVVDTCIRCAMLMDVSDYLYSIRRKDTEF